MKYYAISFPGECDQHVTEIWSEEQILKSSWYKNWVFKMAAAGKHDLISDELAIVDWCVVHWAVEVKSPWDVTPVQPPKTLKNQ
jgi:hypothetical protein